VCGVVLGPGAAHARPVSPRLGDNLRPVLDEYDKHAPRRLLAPSALPSAGGSALLTED
jgi:hypothetical protein